MHASHAATGRCASRTSCRRRRAAALLAPAAGTGLRARAAARSAPRSAQPRTTRHSVSSLTVSPSVSRAVQVWVWAGRTTPQASAPGCVAARAAAQCPRGCSGRGARFHAARHAARQTSRARHTAHDALRTTAHCAQRALSCAQRAVRAHSPLATAHSAQHARAKHIVPHIVHGALCCIILCTARPSPARRRP